MLMLPSYNLSLSLFYTQMKKDSLISALVPNIFELQQQPFLKKETIEWKRFKDKQKLLPLFRTITYQSRSILSKIFLFDIKEEIKEKKVKRELTVLTEKQIISLQQLYQILNENMNQKEFSEQASRIKKYEESVKRYVWAVLHKNLVTYRKNETFLAFNVYKTANHYYVKASFINYNYRFQLTEQAQIKQMPTCLRLDNLLVKQELDKRCLNHASMAHAIKVNEDITKMYKNFYDMTYFHYDQFLLKLQVFNNYPLLRLKNFIPIRFQDQKSGLPLQGPIYSNSDPDCMFQHFVGFNADTIKSLEGDVCELCQLPYDQFQENELLMMLRDNICNPQKRDIIYGPQFNRFKIIEKQKMEQNKEEMPQQGPAYKTIIRHLNYCHFRLNLKKITGKNRLTFYPNTRDQQFPLTFNLWNRQLLIMDPARGKYCQHYSFSDLRLYYLGYDPETRHYKCPIPGCNETMLDTDIFYLKEFAKFKSQKSPELLNTSKILIDHYEKKVHLLYKARQQQVVVPLAKIDEIPDFYKTLVDPYVPFAQYSLGIKDKEREQKMNEYMFGGWRQEMEQQIEQEQEIAQEDDD